MSYKDNFVSVIIPAAGMGKRMKSEINKQFMLIDDKPVLAHTIEKFSNNKYIDEIIVVVREEEIDVCKERVIAPYKLEKVKCVISGGKERKDSVYNGLMEVSEGCDIVLVHDGARPFVTEESIFKGIEAAMEFGGCVIGVPVKDTIKVVNGSNDVIDTPNRRTLWAVQTPQAFNYSILLDAYNRFKEDDTVTDDSMLVEKLGRKVKMIRGSYENIKITTPEDLDIAMTILKNQ